MAAALTTPFTPVSVSSVQMRGFWGERIETVRKVTIPILKLRCDAAGMFDQIDPGRPVPALRIPITHSGTVTMQMFWDSDVAKYLEAAAYALVGNGDAALEQDVDEIVEMFAGLQSTDGYVNSWYNRMQPGRRFTNLRDCHELYCAGHLIEAAVAYWQATGKRRFLDVMCRYADLIEATFGPAEEQLKGYCGHQEIELALVKLARATGERKYMDLAKFFIDQRGQSPHYFDIEKAKRTDPKDYHFATYEYGQAHVPVRQQKTVVGHAVRAMYMYSAMADLAAEYADDSLTETLEILWKDLTGARLYVTGGLGPSEANEGFTSEYDLPNESAYAETCAAVGLVFWASRMLGRAPNRRYSDTLELALYNGALTGLSRDGSRFFYDNPLASRGNKHRWEWHRCPCCPPNIARLVGSVGSYHYSETDGAVAVHLYADSSAVLSIGGGQVVEIDQHTDFPWDGDVRIEVKMSRPARFAMYLRLPGWCYAPTIHLDGEPIDLGAVTRDGYAVIERDWQGGEKLHLSLPMNPSTVHAHPLVREDIGRVAIRRGPLVYCAEEVDNAHPVFSYSVPPGVTVNSSRDAELGGAVRLEVPAMAADAAGWGESLYRQAPPQNAAATLHLIPYFFWDNRSAGEMAIWHRAG